MREQPQLSDHLEAWVNTPRNAIRALLLGIESLETWHATPCPTDDEDERLAALAALEHSLGIDDGEDGFDNFVLYLAELVDRLDDLVDGGFDTTLFNTGGQANAIMASKLEQLSEEVKRIKKIRNIEDRLDSLEEEAASA